MLAARFGDDASARVVVTGPARRTPFALRIPAEVLRFGTTTMRERVLLELPPGRAPPQGSVLELRARPVEPRGPETGFDERGWLSRRGVHVVLRGERPRTVDRRGGIGGVADRLRTHVESTLARGTAGERRQLLAGIVLGEDSGIDRSASRRVRGERAHASARRLGPEHRDHGDRCRDGRPRRRCRAARRRRHRDRRRARVRARGRMAAVGRARGGRGRARVARLDRRPATRPLARTGGRRARAAGVDADLGARARVPAVLRGGRGDLRRAASSVGRARGIPRAAKALGRLRRGGRVRRRHGADRLAPLRHDRALDRAGERRRRARHGAADRARPRRGGDRAGLPRSSDRAGVARRLVRVVDRARRPDRRRMAVGAGRIAGRARDRGRRDRSRLARPTRSSLPAQRLDRRTARERALPRGSWMRADAEAGLGGTRVGCA